MRCFEVRDIFLGVVVIRLDDFIVRIVGEAEESRAEPLVENGFARELEDLLLLDRIGGDRHDFPAPDKNSAGDLSHHRFEERYRSAVERQRDGVAADRNVADIVDPALV